MRGTLEDFSGDFEIFDLYELELHNVLLLNVLPTSYFLLELLLFEILDLYAHQYFQNRSSNERFMKQMYELFRHYFSHPCGRERRESVEMEGLRVGRTCSDNYRSYFRPFAAELCRGRLCVLFFMEFFN